MHFFFLSFTIFFFMICDWPIEVVQVSSAVVFFFILVTLDLCLLLIYCDFFKFSKISNFNFQSSIFVVISVNLDLDFFFLFFLRFVTRNTPFLKISLWKTCSKCLPLNCHYHQIGFALKQVVPVSYYVIKL